MIDQTPNSRNADGTAFNGNNGAIIGGAFFFLLFLLLFAL